MKKITCSLLLSGAAALMLVSGCKNFDEYKNERAAYAVKHFERAQYSNIDEKKTYSLLDCVKYAVRNNLDLKVFGIEEQVAKEMRTSEMLGMLPELNVTENLTGRGNTPASSSKQIRGEGTGTYSYSQSTDRTVNYLNIDLALSVIDFGLAFFNTQQANDRMLLRQQRTRRAEQNLVLDVSRVYFQVAASQRAITITKKLLADCKNSQKMIEELGRAGKITPFRAFDESRRFMEMEKRLKNYIRSYENSCVELRSLMGLYPSGTILVNDSILDKVPQFDFPDMLLMEQIALMKRPELFEIDMQKHVNVLECRKTIVTMFPNVRIFLDFTNSNNSFLYHTGWLELGLRAAYNLLKLPQQIARYQAYSSQVDAEEYRTYAQAIAVMAQVRMAHANLLAMKDVLDVNTRFYNVYAENLKKAEAGNRLSGDLSKLEIDHMRLTTAETEIEKYLSLGNYYVSYFRILNTLGIENLQSATVDQLKKELADAKLKAAEELKKARAEYAAKQQKAAPAVKKEAVKKEAVKKEAVKKEAVKKEAVKPVAKKEAVKPAAKPVAKKAEAKKECGFWSSLFGCSKKAEAKKPEAKKAAPAAKKETVKPAAKAAPAAKKEAVKPAAKEEGGFWSSLFGGSKKAEAKKPEAKKAAPAAKPAVKPAPAAKPAAVRWDKKHMEQLAMDGADGQSELLTAYIMRSSL